MATPTRPLLLVNQTFKLQTLYVSLESFVLQTLSNTGFWDLNQQPSGLHVHLLCYLLVKYHISYCDFALYLNDLLFRVQSSTGARLSRTALVGDERRIREVAGAPRLVCEDPRRSLSSRCLTGSYSMSSCNV